MYYLRTMHGGSVFAVIKQLDLVRLHQRLGHPSYGSLAQLSMLCDFLLNKEFLDCCDVWYRAKQTRSSFSLSDSRASKPFDLIHCDLWGCYHTPSLFGCHYFCVLWMILAVPLGFICLKIKRRLVSVLCTIVGWLKPSLKHMLKGYEVIMGHNSPK